MACYLQTNRYQNRSSIKYLRDTIKFRDTDKYQIMIYY